MTHSYALDLGTREWYGTAESLAQAIQIAEAELGKRVIRGRCVDHYTPPGAGEFVDIRAFQAAMRAMERDAQALYRGMQP